LGTCLFYQSFHNLPRFWGLVIFSKISRTCHVSRDLYFFHIFLKPATFLGTCNFFQSSRNLPRF
jgi:hypothetical protein